MHSENKFFWKYCKEKYQKYFSKDVRVLEVGSFNVNGSIRQFFEHVPGYIGVDWRPGPGVDVVCLAHEMCFEGKFDTIVSGSMLEHDPYWDRSIERMSQLMKDDGIMILSFGTAYNQKHCLETAPDGEFHALKCGLVISKIKELGLYLHEFLYEIDTPGLPIKKVRKLKRREKDSEVAAVIVFKNSEHSIGEKRILPVRRRDRL